MFYNVSMPEFKKLSRLHKYGAAISFLAMEIFALIAFSFGSSYILYGALSLALLVLLILFNIKEISVDGMSSIALFFLPLFLFTVVTALGVYSRAHLHEGDFNIGELVFIPLGLLPMSFSGYLLSIDKTFKISTFLTVIFSALGVLCLINLIVNLVNFGPFYTVIYKGYHMYYGGVMSDVTIDDMAYVLEGFKFIEVDISHYVLYPALLLTSSIGLFFISPSKKREFVTYILFTVVAVLSLILVPATLGLFAAIVILLIDGVICLLKYVKGVRKISKYVLAAVITIGVVGYVFMILNQNIGFINNMTTNSGLLNRIFNSNRFANRFNPLIERIFTGDRFLGYAVDNPTTRYEAHMSGSFFFDFFMTSGVIGLVAFIFALVIGYRAFNKYFRSENDPFHAKTILISFVTFFLIYSGTFASAEYGVFYRIRKPIYMTGPFMIMVFIFSYVLAKAEVKQPKTIQETPQMEVNIDE